MDRIVVATDDEGIKKAVEGFGGEAILTRHDHRTGTDRVAEVAAHVAAEIYVNVQGDEPLIDPGTIDALVAAMMEDASAQIATPCSAISQPNDIMDPNVVKVVRDFDGNALYFSRAPIPWVRETSETAAAQHWKHLGLYAFRRDALLEFPTLPPGNLSAWSSSSSFAGSRMAFTSRWWRRSTMRSAWMCRPTWRGWRSCWGPSQGVTKVFPGASLFLGAFIAG